MESNQYYGKKVLVTGASGFIGSHLCDRLNDLGAEVHGVSRKTKPGDSNKLRWWQGDLSDIKVVRKILNAVKPEIVFHLASHVVGARNLEIVLTTFRSNLASTVNLLTLATEIRCNRIVLVGSQEEPEPGDTVAIPSSPYAAAKWSGSAYARMFHALYKTPVTLVRLFMVYGPGQQDIKKLIPYVTLSLLKGEAPELTSGKRLVDWIYVKDVVNGLIKIAQAKNVEGCTLDIGSGSLVSIRDVVQKLVRITNPDIKPLFGRVPDRPMEQVRVANIKDTYNTIGWKPITAIEKGLSFTVNWYREQLHKINQTDPLKK